ncbi:MAG: HAD family hydrolase [Pseudomonadota bacterium]
MDLSPIKGIIFDKDGTLFDFATTWEVWAQEFLLRLAGGNRLHAAELGQAVAFDFEAGRFAKSSVVIAGTPEDIADALLPLTPGFNRETLLQVMNTAAEEAPQKEAVPLVPLLQDLRARGLRLGVATNDAEVPATAHLEQAGITDYFDFVAGSDSGHGAKPGPGQLSAFARLMDLSAQSCVMVGDSLNDLMAGRAAGMQTFAVLTGMADAEVLRPYADVLRPDIGHLPPWLDQIAAP